MYRRAAVCVWLARTTTILRLSHVCILLHFTISWAWNWYVDRQQSRDLCDSLSRVRRIIFVVPTHTSYIMILYLFFALRMEPVLGTSTFVLLCLQYTRYVCSFGCFLVHANAKLILTVRTYVLASLSFIITQHAPATARRQAVHGSNEKDARAEARPGLSPVLRSTGGGLQHVHPVLRHEKALDLMTTHTATSTLVHYNIIE